MTELISTSRSRAMSSCSERERLCWDHRAAGLGAAAALLIFLFIYIYYIYIYFNSLPFTVRKNVREAEKVLISALANL